MQKSSGSLGPPYRRSKAPETTEEWPHKGETAHVGVESPSRVDPQHRHCHYCNKPLDILDWSMILLFESGGVAPGEIGFRKFCGTPSIRIRMRDDSRRLVRCEMTRLGIQCLRRSTGQLRLRVLALHGRRQTLLCLRS